MSDDGLTDHCACCAHRRTTGCGGPDCPCSPTPRRIMPAGWKQQVVAELAARKQRKETT